MNSSTSQLPSTSGRCGPAAREPVRVLMIEDNAVAARLIWEMFREVGGTDYELDTVATLADARQYLVSSTSHVVLLDLDLPDAHGLEGLHQLRSDAPSVPIVILTGLGDESIALEAARAGAQDYLVKGHFERETLTRAVRYAIERQRAAQALERSESRCRSIVTNAVYGIYRSTAAGRFVSVNPALTDMLGYGSATELLSVDMATLYSNASERQRVIGEFRDRGHLDGVEVQWRRRDGAPITVHLTGRVNENEHGEPDEFEVFVEDVTERRNLEEQLRQSQKMEGLGRLAGGIAHDFNNILGVITGYGDLLVKQLDHGDPCWKRVEEIRKAAARAAELTRQLLAFSRGQMLEPKILDLNAVVAGIDTMLGRLIGEDIDHHAKLEPSLWRVEADASKLEQVIVNLAVNARQAMPRGGELILETANVELDARYVANHVEARVGPHAVLTVSDTGVGMDADTRARIFEPFFTTKGPGEGTGLGLATVYGIVKQSGGHIGVYSEPGRGTTFKVYLPRAEGVGGDEAGSARPLGPRSTAGTETILLVEDDGALREMVSEVLEAAGYTVLQRDNPLDALQTASDDEHEFQLVVTDVVMPKMSGREMIERLATMGVQPKVLYMSGYTEETIARRGLIHTATGFLEKPFTAEALLSSVRQMLDEPPARRQS